MSIGCVNMSRENYSQTTPKLIIEEFFIGETSASGIFEDRFGNVRRQFTVDIRGEWNGKVLKLNEEFTYSDGEQEKRVWKIKKNSPSKYVGTASDLAGFARGVASGNSLNWQYDMMLKVGKNILKVHFDDWMFLQKNGVLINRAIVSKFGIDIGRITLAFTKANDERGPLTESLDPRENSLGLILQ